MVTTNHYRWDFIGLSTDVKPTPATSVKVVDGSTYYTSDDSKLYVWYEDQWYEKTVEGGGGGTTYTAGDGIDITNSTISVDTDTIQEKLTAGTGIDITDNTISATGGGGGDTVYSDKSTSDSTTGGAVYIGNLNASQEEQADPTTTDSHYKYFWALPNSNSRIPKDGTVCILGENNHEAGIVIGNGASTYNDKYYGVAIGNGASVFENSGLAIGIAASCSAENSVSLGRQAAITSSGHKNSVALGSFAQCGRSGEININTGGTNMGYNSTDYRVIGGVHDGQLAHDAVTVEQVNSVIDAINTALSTNIPHIGA